MDIDSKWFTSYLSERCQIVVVNGTCSDVHHVVNGVSQDILKIKNHTSTKDVQSYRVLGISV